MCVSVLDEWDSSSCDLQSAVQAVLFLLHNYDLENGWELPGKPETDEEYEENKMQIDNGNFDEWQSEDDVDMEVKINPQDLLAKVVEVDFDRDIYEFYF